MPPTDRFKISAFLTLLLPFLGITGACIGGSSAPAPGGAPPSSVSGPAVVSNESPVTAAATPGQQPTEWGTVGDNPPLFLVRVASPDGTVDLSTDLLASANELKAVDDSHCKTKQSDSAPPIFSGEAKPLVYSSSSIPPIQSTWSTNACGQLLLNCPIADPKEGKNMMEVYAAFNDNGSIYRSDTVKIECIKKDYPPVTLSLKPMFSRTGEEIIPASTPSEINQAEKAVK